MFMFTSFSPLLFLSISEVDFDFVYLAFFFMTLVNMIYKNLFKKSHKMSNLIHKLFVWRNITFDKSFSSNTETPASVA